MKRLVAVSLLYLLAVWLLISGVWNYLPYNKVPFSSAYFIAGILVALVALGWWYVIASLFENKEHPYRTLKKQIDRTLHELNIPLATIKANVQLLNKQCDDSRAKERLERIEGATKRLEREYEILLHFLKGKMGEVVKEHFCLDVLVAQRVEFFSQMNRQRFVVDLEKYEVVADKIGFEQVIDNLIDNAMKYSPKHSIITVTLKEAKLCIVDEGEGMDEIELIHLFEHYYQGKHSKKGMGLGLAFVKEFSDMYGMHITIDSKKGIGTKICIELHSIAV